MDTCVLIPDELGLVLTLHPNPSNVLEMVVDIWSNVHICSGTVFRPDQGRIRLDKLEVYSKLTEDDIRYKFGCYDEIVNVEGREVRHCNWIRFTKSSSNIDDVNVVAIKAKDEPIFQTVKNIKPNDEIIVFYDATDDKIKPEPEVLPKEITDQEKSPEIDKDKSFELSPVSIATRGLITSPLAREDDCRSSLSDVTSGGEDCDKLDQVKSESSDVTNSSPEVTSSVSDRPIKRNRERTWLPCEVCGKKFDRPSLLKRHMRTHTGEKPHACDICGKAFSTSSSLNTHRRIHSGEKPHQCKVCGKRFTASSNLYYHRMTHNKEKPHKCTLCSKSFPTPGDLRSHMYVHNGSWPFKCDVCNRGFSKQTNLKNHLLLHSGDKPHECRVCGKKFALQCNLKTHQKTHEGDGQEECVTCGKSYSSSNVSPNRHGQCPNCSPDNAENCRKAQKFSSDFSISRLTESTPKRNADMDPRNLVNEFPRDPLRSPPYDRSPPYFTQKPVPFPVHTHGGLSPITSSVTLSPRLYPGLSPLGIRQPSVLSPSDNMKLFSYHSDQYRDSRLLGSDVSPFGNDTLSRRHFWSSAINNGY